MYKFKLTSEQFKSVLTYLKSKPVAQVEHGLPTMYKVENDSEHIFTGAELAPILAFLSQEPYAAVAEILNSIYPLTAINKDEVDAELAANAQPEKVEPLVVSIEKKKRGRKPKASNV